MERLTLIGLYNYDDSLFDITLPTGIDEDMTVDAILHRGGQFEVIYPDYDFLKASITSWFNRHYRTFDKWITALNIEYDPLNNYDRYEESADNRAVSGNESGSVKDNSLSATSETANGATNGATTGNQNNTVTNNISAFDSSTYQAKDQQISSGTDSSTTTGVTNSNSNTNTSTNNTSEDERSHNTIDQNKHTAHLYGNIGVTTSQQMLQSELDIARFNIYDQIAELFIDDFCIMVY